MIFRWSGIDARISLLSLSILCSFLSYDYVDDNLKSVARQASRSTGKLFSNSYVCVG